jgi:putative ABC transport system substrate-binding protein
MKRRAFITLLGGAAAWPVAANAQQGERVRRIGALMAFAESDPLAQSWVKVFEAGLTRLGWNLGQTLRIDYRWTAGVTEKMGPAAAELVKIGPDVLLAGNNPTTAALQRETREIPIVFVLVADPIGNGFVTNFARPDRNITGFITSDPPQAGKQLELLKKIASGIKKVALIYNPVTAPHIVTWLPIAQESAASLNIEIAAVHVHNAEEITTAIAARANEPDTGLFVAPDITTGVNRQLIAKLAAQHGIPAVYPYRFFTTVGGLASYGTDIAEHYRLAAGYIDRILKGETPVNLPVQAPTKFELVINIKAAEALKLEIPPTLLAIADEVID